MKSASTDRRISKIADLDREKVRELCELHPWGLGRLSSGIGLERTALSHFFSGRRPLPQTFAAKFLRQIGLTVKGEMDFKHCFWLSAKAGMEDVAVSWISQIFPNGGKLIKLSNAGHSYEHEQLPQSEWVFGVALFDGNAVALMRDEIHFEDHSWIPGEWKVVDTNEFADDLLGVENAPSKADIVELMESAKNYDYEEHMWGRVRDIAKEYGLSGDQVLDLVKNGIPGYKEPVYLDSEGQEMSSLNFSRKIAEVTRK